MQVLLFYEFERWLFDYDSFINGAVGVEDVIYTQWGKVCINKHIWKKRFEWAEGQR